MTESRTYIADELADILDGRGEDPVAWMASNGLLFSVVKDEIYHIPLYTHPCECTKGEK